MDDYSHLYEYMYDLFYKLEKQRSRYYPNYYELEALGRRETEKFKKEVNGWESKWVLSDKLIQPGPLEPEEVYGVYEVKPETVPEDLKDQITEEYLKPTVKRFIKPKTKELFGDIL